jgi:hypothetical protein
MHANDRTRNWGAWRGPTGWWAVLVITTVLLIVGCGGPGVAERTPTGEARQPFSARTESAEGAIVAWSGYVDGYQSGAEEQFDITIKNGTDETWRGRYCLQLVGDQHPGVVATLEQRPFTVESGVGFSESITVQLPGGVGEGAYALSLVVRGSGGPMVDLLPIQIGDADDVRRSATAQDTSASLEACPPPAEAYAGSLASLEALARAALAKRLGIDTGDVEVQDVTPVEFADVSLGVPEPGKSYAQVVRPGYVIELTAQGQTYVYHGSGERVVAVPAHAEGQSGSDRIIISGVDVTADHVIVRGQSSLPDGACVTIELWADGTQQAWWPPSVCSVIEQGAWERVVELEAEQVLQPGVQYVVRAYQPGGPDIVATFAFDLDGPQDPNQ